MKSSCYLLGGPIFGTSLHWLCIWCILLYKYTYIYIHTFTDTHIYIYIHIDCYLRMYIYIYISLNIHIHLHIAYFIWVPPNPGFDIFFTSGFEAPSQPSKRRREEGFRDSTFSTRISSLCVSHDRELLACGRDSGWGWSWRFRLGMAENPNGRWWEDVWMNEKCEDQSLLFIFFWKERWRWKLIQ